MEYFYIITSGIVVGTIIIALAFPAGKRNETFKKYLCFKCKIREYIAVVLCYAAILALLYRTYYLSVNLFFYGFLFALLVLACLKDLKEGIIPDKIVIAAMAGGICFSLISSSMTFLDAITGGAATASILGFMSFITKGGLGLGDVKLFAGAALYMGLGSSISAMAVSTLASGVFALVLLAVNPKNRKRCIPFAPFILIGTLAAVVM